MDRQEFWSAAMDDELSDEEFLALVEKEGCSEATTAWRQYRLVGDHLRHGQSQRCLCHKIMGVLEAQQKESPLVVPSSLPISAKHHLWGWVPQNFMGQTATAAGVLGAAVLLAFGGAMYFSPATQQAIKVNPMAATLPESQQATASETAQSTLNIAAPTALNTTKSVTYVASNVDAGQSSGQQGSSASSITASASISSREKSLLAKQAIRLQPVATNLATTDASSSDDVMQNVSIDEMNFLHQANAGPNFGRPGFFLTDNTQ